MAKPKVRTALQVSYLPAATCVLECGWKADSPSARDAAKAHTLETGHRTRVETLSATVYKREEA